MSTFSPSEISSRLRAAGLRPAYASMLAHGKRRPSLELAVELEVVTGIPPRFWIKRDDASHEGEPDGTLNDAPVSGVGQ